MKKASEARSGTKNGRHNKLKQREGQKDEKKEKVLLFSFVLAAFLLRIYMTTLEYSVVWDGYYYGVLGKNLISGRFDEGLSTYWPPLYPLLVGISSLFFSDPKFAASFVSVVAGSLLIIPVYFLIKEFYGKKAAPMGAFLVIVYPSLVVYSSVFLTEATYTLLFTTGILTGWFAITREKGLWFILTGLLFAACYLVKPEAFAFIGLVLVLVLSATLLRRKLRLTRTYSHLSLLLIGFVVLSFPYLLYLHEKTGQWTLSQKMNLHLFSGVPNLYVLTEDRQGTIADRLWVGRAWQGDSPSGVMQSGSAGISDYLIRPQAFAFVGLLLVLVFSAAFIRKKLRSTRTFSDISPLLMGFVLLSFLYPPPAPEKSGSQIIEAQPIGAQSKEDTLGEIWLASLQPHSESQPGEAQSSDSEVVGTQAGEVDPDPLTRLLSKFSSSEILKRGIENLPGQFITLIKIVPPLLVLLAILGLLRDWSRERVGKEIYLSSFLFSALFGYSSTTATSESRLLVPLVPIIICWSAKGIVELENLIEKTGERIHGPLTFSGKKRGLLGPLVLAVIVLTLIPSFIHIMKESEKLSKGREVVGRWLKKHSSPSTSIMAINPWPVFYADGKHLFLPSESYPVVAEYARRKKVDYIVIEQELNAANRHLKFLLLNRSDEDLRRLAPDLEPVYKYNRPGAKIVVFKLTDTASTVAGQPAPRS